MLLLHTIFLVVNIHLYNTSYSSDLNDTSIHSAVYLKVCWAMLCCEKALHKNGECVSERVLLFGSPWLSDEF